MIHVDRSRVPRPSFLDSDQANEERAAAKAAFTGQGRSRQHRFEFQVYRQPQVRDPLNELFYGKCAYCEVKVAATGPPFVELYRPKASVQESPEHPGYWWLATDWDNMLISCMDCNRVRLHAGEKAGKGNRFPLVDESKRAFHPGEETRERPLLLDPCRDDPESHLVFDAKGRVVSDTPFGQTSISVLGLNRAGLVEARSAAATQAVGMIDRMTALIKLGEEIKAGKARDQWRANVRSDVAALRALTEASQEFAALKRQLVRPMLDRLAKEGLIDETPDAAIPTPKITKSRHTLAKSSFRAYEVAQSSFSLENESGRETYRSERRLIERVVIHNVKAIRDLDLDLTNYGTGRTPWLMLLGENGTGKSTILQAIALTLVGASAFARLGNMGAVHPGDFVRYRCKSGTVSVKLSGFLGPHRLTFRDDRVEFTSPTGEKATVKFGPAAPSIEGTGWEPQTILLGYGATRLLPRASSSEVTSVGDTYSRVDNLFDPFVPLFDAEGWLAHQPRLQFDTAALVLKDLLRLEEDATFLVKDGRVLVDEHGDKVPLRQLSDGYQSVLATAIDILQVMTRLWPNLVDAEGIVLLDEIGAHLHPTWKMRIVGSMRRAVPGIQFVTSTHDPLCLRGLGAGEVVVMQRDEDDKVRALTGLPSPGDFRIDQLLTSDFFGMSTTVDPDTEALFDEYYALLALPDPTPQQAQRTAELQVQLKDRRYMGTTLREMLMYEAVDRVVAEHRRSAVRPLKELTDEAADEVARIWAEDEASVATP